jgi:hypothetical protein
VIEEQVRSILAANDSPDIGFDLSVNPYRGCDWAQLLRQRVEMACTRLGPNRERFELDMTQFRRPATTPGQGSLF